MAHKKHKRRIVDSERGMLSDEDEKYYKKGSDVIQHPEFKQRRWEASLMVSVVSAATVLASFLVVQMADRAELVSIGRSVLPFSIVAVVLLMNIGSAYNKSSTVITNLVLLGIMVGIILGFQGQFLLNLALLS